MKCVCFIMFNTYYFCFRYLCVTSSKGCPGVKRRAQPSARVRSGAACCIAGAVLSACFCDSVHDANQELWNSRSLRSK